MVHGAYKAVLAVSAAILELVTFVAVHIVELSFFWTRRGGRRDDPGLGLGAQFARPRVNPVVTVGWSSDVTSDDYFRSKMVKVI